MSPEPRTPPPPAYLVDQWDRLDRRMHAGGWIRRQMLERWLRGDPLVGPVLIPKSLVVLLGALGVVAGVFTTAQLAQLVTGQGVVNMEAFIDFFVQNLLPLIITGGVVQQLKGYLKALFAPVAAFFGAQPVWVTRLASIVIGYLYVAITGDLSALPEIGVGVLLGLVTSFLAWLQARFGDRFAPSV